MNQIIIYLVCFINLDIKSRIKIFPKLTYLNKIDIKYLSTFYNTI